MNQINPDKLQHSKWTAATPERKEKHFLVTELLLDDCDNVTDVVLEAVLTCRTRACCRFTRRRAGGYFFARQGAGSAL